MFMILYRNLHDFFERKSAIRRSIEWIWQMSRLPKNVQKQEVLKSSLKQQARAKTILRKLYNKDSCVLFNDDGPGLASKFVPVVCGRRIFSRRVQSMPICKRMLAEEIAATVRKICGSSSFQAGVPEKLDSSYQESHKSNCGEFNE